MVDPRQAIRDKRPTYHPEDGAKQPHRDHKGRRALESLLSGVQLGAGLLGVVGFGIIGTGPIWGPICSVITGKVEYTLVGIGFPLTILLGYGVCGGIGYEDNDPE